MTNPFDDVIESIRRQGYHNHRRQDHSRLVSEGMLRDLREQCPRIRSDLDTGAIEAWFDHHIPASRGTSGSGRLADLLIGPRDPEGPGEPSPDFRVCVEHKSVATAHRNVRARFGDLNEVLEMVHRGQPHAILVATVLLGVADRFLNVPDRITPFHDFETFERKIRPRLSSGDVTLWTEFKAAVSQNRPGEPKKTLAVFRELKRRPIGRTDIIGYDYLLVVPVAVDNVNPPSVARQNDLGIDVDADYASMLRTICDAYQVRWP